MQSVHRKSNAKLARRGFIGISLATLTGALGAKWLVDERGRYFVCRRQVDDCYTNDLQAVNQSLASVDQYFNTAISKAPAMVTDLMDYGSTAKLAYKSASDWWYGSDTTDEYVRCFLKAYLDLPDGLEKALRETTSEIEVHWLANEQMMYSQIEAELRSQQVPVHIDRVSEQMKRRVDQEMIATARLNGKLSGGRIVVADLILGSIGAAVVARVIAAIAARIGTSATSAGVAAAGAAGAPWTAGASLLVGILVGMLIEYIAGQIQYSVVVSQIQAALDEVRNQMKVEIVHAAGQIAEKMRDARRQGLTESI